MKCPNCNKILTDNAKTCGLCGFAIYPDYSQVNIPPSNYQYSNNQFTYQPNTHNGQAQPNTPPQGYNTSNSGMLYQQQNNFNPNQQQFYPNMMYGQQQNNGYDNRFPNGPSMTYQNQNISGNLQNRSNKTNNNENVYGCLAALISLIFGFIFRGLGGIIALAALIYCIVGLVKSPKKVFGVMGLILSMLSIFVIFTLDGTKNNSSSSSQVTNYDDTVQVQVAVNDSDDMTTESTAVETSDYSFTETELYHDDDVEIKLTDYSEKNGIPEFSMTIVNTSDNNYEINNFYGAINGIMQCCGTDETSIAAGKTLTTKLKFRSSEFDMVDISTIYNVAVKIFLNSDDGNKQIETEFTAFDVRQGDYSFNGDVFYEDDNYLVYKVYVSEDLKDCKLRLHNKKDFPISVYLDDYSVNDNMCYCDTSFSMGYGLWTFSTGAVITPDYDVIIDIIPNEETLSEKGISDISNIEFKIKGHDSSEMVYFDDGSGDSEAIRIEK